MNVKQYLKNLIDSKNKKVADLRSKAKASDDVNEVRAIGDEIESIQNEVKEAEAQLNEVEAEEARGNAEEGKDVEARGFNPLATYGLGNVKENRSETGDATDSVEFRTAFMNLVLNGKPIPSELRDNQNTLTSDVASVIPTVIINRIIERFTVCGMILPQVTRTNYAAGVVIPTSNVKPVATWVAEGATSDRQKKTTGKVTFSYFKLRCEISMSMEVGTMALSAFETAFVANVADAMVVAVEEAILAGDGTTQPKGILTEGVGSYSDHVITTTGKNGAITYKDLVAMEAALPIEYENTAKWFMTKKQFMAFVGMTDDQGQPIARVDWGFEGRPNRVLMGREVIIHPYATQMGTNLAGIFDFRDYVLNTIYDMGIQRKQSWETEDLLTKAVMSVDGKPVDNYSLILLQAGA